MTRSTVTPAIGPSAWTTSPRVPQGPQMRGSEGPKMTTGGTPKAAAMWAGPESLPTKRAGAGNQGLDLVELRAGDGCPCGERGKVLIPSGDEHGLDPVMLAQVFGDAQKAVRTPGFFRRRGDRMNDGVGRAPGPGGSRE